MSEQHTPEPWDSFCDVCESSTPHPESEPIVRIGFADYKRARACVNACKGFTDPDKDIRALESGCTMHHNQAMLNGERALVAEKQRDDLIETTTADQLEIYDLKRQRDELLVAAQKALDECCDVVATDAGRALEAAIASAKGGAA